jgi:uncharacterized protein (DUF433 family)
VRTLDSHIEVTPGVASGRPTISGRRITVRDIAIWHERLGRNADEISADHDLTLAEVYAALAYYFDHRDELDRDIEESAAFVEALKERIPSKLHAKLSEQTESGSEA